MKRWSDRAAGVGVADRQRQHPPPPRSAVPHRRLRNPFTPQPVFSDDQIQAMHETALARAGRARPQGPAAGSPRTLRAKPARWSMRTVSWSASAATSSRRALASAPRSFTRARRQPLPADLLLETGSLAFVRRLRHAERDRYRTWPPRRHACQDFEDLTRAHPELRRAAYAGTLCRAAGCADPSAPLCR